MTDEADDESPKGWRFWRRPRSPMSSQAPALQQQPEIEVEVQHGGTATQNDPSPQLEYSRAFENIVTGSDDIIGLLGYALFKEAVREEARQGNVAPGSSRNPTRATVEAFRMAAEQRITEVINRGIEQATPTIQQTATNSAIAGAVGELKAHMTQRTGFGMAFLTNILAWAATLAIAVMILFLANRTSVENAILGETEERMTETNAVLPVSTEAIVEPTRNEGANRQ